MNQRPSPQAGPEPTPSGDDAARPPGDHDPPRAAPVVRELTAIGYAPHVAGSGRQPAATSRPAVKAVWKPVVKPVEPAPTLDLGEPTVVSAIPTLVAATEAARTVVDAPVPKRRRFSRRWLFGLALPALSLGWGLWLLAEGASSEAGTPSVQQAVVTRGSLLVKVVETGKVEPGQQAQIRSRVGGIVTEVPVQEGQRVEAGQVLIRLDPTDYLRDVQRTRADVQEKRSQLRLARWHSESVRRGMREGVVARAEQEAAANDLALARARLQSALAALRTSEDQVGYTTVVAPFAGRVIARNVQPGEVVVPGMTATVEGRPLLVLATTGELLIRIDLNQIDFSRVQMDRKVRIELDSAPGKTFTGKVVSLAASANPGSAGVEVLPIKVRFDPGQDVSAITPGMVADVEIEIDHRENVLLLPIEAVAQQDGNKAVRVWSPASQAFESRVVKTGAHDDSQIEIREGLPEGARVQVGGPTGEGS